MRLSLLAFIKLIAIFTTLASGCSNDGNSVVAVGTLERDRAELRAPVMERIVERHFSDGETVAAGDVILELNRATVQARLAQAEAEAAGADARLAEIRRGARKERIEQAQAALASAESELAQARSELQRQQGLATDGLTSASRLEEAQKAAEVTAASVERNRAALAELLNGATPEELAQAEASARAAAARVEELRIQLGELTIRAPFNGRIEQVLVEPGDRVAAGALLVTVFRKGAPHARVFLPADMKAQVSPGDRRAVRVDGHGCYEARLRYIASEAVFTPYYALREQDRGRLVYPAELQLPESAAALPTGIGVEVLANDTCTSS